MVISVELVLNINIIFYVIWLLNWFVDWNNRNNYLKIISKLKIRFNLNFNTQHCTTSQTFNTHWKIQTNSSSTRIIFQIYLVYIHITIPTTTWLDNWISLVSESLVIPFTIFILLISFVPFVWHNFKYNILIYFLIW